MTSDGTPEPGHGEEQHGGGVAGRLNRLRAGVLGANDGIVSVAGLVAGVAGASASRGALLTAGLAGLVAGALSMAGGEYVSVSTQRDTERSLLRRERWELANLPDQELAELAAIYAAKGVDADLARRVAEQLTARDALGAHAEAELHLDPDERANPWAAAGTSLGAFVLGGLLPLVAVLLPPASWRVPVCAAAVALALALTGAVSARLGDAPARPAVLRNVGVGLLAMAVTYAVGLLAGAAIG